MELDGAECALVRHRSEESTPMVIIGIDPGVTGAVGVLCDGAFQRLCDLPVADKGLNSAELTALLRSVISDHLDDGLPTVVLERQWAFPKAQGGVCAAFRKGECYGIVKGVCASLGLPVVLVTPQVWKKWAGLTKDKEKARAMAQNLYPTAPLGLKKHHGRAEALLIARWYEKQEGSK